MATRLGVGGGACWPSACAPPIVATKMVTSALSALRSIKKDMDQVHSFTWQSDVDAVATELHTPVAVVPLHRDRRCFPHEVCPAGLTRQVSPGEGMQNPFVAMNIPPAPSQ